MNKPTPSTRLTEIPVLSHLFKDPAVQLSVLPFDARWSYFVDQSLKLSHFNPHSGKVFIKAHSAVDKWLLSDCGPVRDHNAVDRLVKEVVLAAHDYLHAWAYLTIVDCVPTLGLGTTPIDRDNVEDFVFCHLLTEAIATVGLDYWFLSTVDLNELCGAGTGVSGFSTTYRETQIEEFQRFNPRFLVQDKSFLSEMAEFYCTGSLTMLSLEHVRQSGQLYIWVEHELRYGQMQREYSREWMSHLAGEDLYRGTNLRGPVSCDAPWKKKLIGNLGEILWDKIKNDKIISPTSRLDLAAQWQRPKDAPLDFRFTNLARLEGLFPKERAPYVNYFRQLVGMHDLDAVDEELRTLLLAINEKPEIPIECLEYLLRDIPVVEERSPLATIPTDIFSLL